MSLLPQWTHVDAPVASGELKTCPEDFRVSEELGFEPEGSGEHVYLYIEKTGLNTQEMAHHLARQLMIHPKKISYSGLKDKWALTRQWLSIHTRREIDPADINTDACRALKIVRHRSKLKRGTHRTNRFGIVIRAVSNAEDLDERIERINTRGVPNYFGEQRFGRNGANVEKARELLAGRLKPGRHQRGLYLSAARALLFNEILSERVIQGNWASGLPGEAMILDGSNSFFCIEALDDEIRSRLSRFDIHPSAPLWGVGESASRLDALVLEQQVLAAYPELTHGLEQQGLRQLRRATRLVPSELSCRRLQDDSVELRFNLGRGAFATTVLRELFTISQPAQNTNS